MLNNSALDKEDSLQEEILANDSALANDTALEEKTMYFDQMVTGDTDQGESADQEEPTVVLEEKPELMAEQVAPAEEVAESEVAEEQEAPVEEVVESEVMEVAEAVDVTEAEESGEATVENVPSPDATVPRTKRVLRKKSTPSRVYAGFFVRFTAYLLDKIIVGVPLAIVRLILWMLQDADSSSILLRKIFFSFTLTDIILYLVSIAYFVLMTYFMGRTFGKRIMKLKVVSVEDRKLTFFEVAFREIIGRYLSTVILYIGYLMIGAGEQKEALHDYLADTRVVYSLD